MKVHELSTVIENLLEQIENAILQLTDSQYKDSIPLLIGSSIGEHVRHVLEFYIELYRGYQSGIVNYDNRERDHNLQTSRVAAVFQIKQLNTSLKLENRSLKILSNCGHPSAKLDTNYARELLYNLDHTLHHMALIRIGISLTAKILLPDNFGIAAATINFKKTCAQ